MQTPAKNKQETSIDQPARFGTRLRRWLLVGTVLLAILSAVILLAPTILARTSLRNVAVQKALPDFPGQITIRSLQLGWFSPVRLEGLTVIGREGKQLADVSRIETEKSLWQLATGWQDVGRVRIIRPKLDVVLRSDGSNVEDVIAPWMKEEAKTSSQAVRVVLEITEGSADVVDQATNRCYKCDNLAISLHMPADARAPMAVKASGEIGDEQDVVGSFAVELSRQTSGGSPGNLPGLLGRNGEIAVQARSLPLDLVDYAARRGKSDLHVSGRLSAEGELRWSEEGPVPKLDASVSATVNELELASPSLIGADVLRSASSTISTELRLVGDRGFLDRLSVTSDLGQADLSARVTVSEFLSSVAASNWLDVLRGHDMHSSGQIGLAQVARTFPELLRMREDIELRSGQIEWNVTSRAHAENQRHWQGQLGTADLQIVRDGRPLALRLPVSVTFSAQDTTEGVTLDRLAVESDFLQLAGRGRLAEGELELHGDLARLASELAQVVDLGDVQLRGQMEATARWQTAASQTNMEGRFTLDDFEFASPGRDVWNEQKLVVGISGKGSYRDDALREISQANVFVESGADRLQVQLTHAVAENFAEAAWPLRCQLAGELATWQRRVEPFYPLAGWSLAGNTNASADARVSRALVEIESAAAEVHQFQVAGGSLSIKEPTVKLSTTGSWNQTQQQWVSARTTLATSAVSIGATDLSVNLQPTPAASGAIGYQGDLGRLSKWLADSEWALGNGISGQFSGQLRLAYEDGVTRFRASSNVQDVSIHELPSQSITRHVSLGSTPAKPLWHEPRVTIAASGGYLASEDRIEFSQVDVAAAPLQISGRGFATELTTRPTVDVTGSMDYDLAVLVERFRGYLGDQIAINGRNKRDFVVRGPLLVASSSADVNTQPQDSGSLSPANAVVANELHAATGIEWSSAEVYGIPIGPGQLSGALSRGTIQIQPLSLSAGSGRLTLAPELSLNSQPMLLTAEPGPLMEQIEITPEMCNTWLKFVAPLLADATRAEGSFSAHLAGARIPVMEPASGEVGGTLIIHEARMGPGPLAQQFLGLAQQVKDILRRRPGSSQIVDSSQPWVYLGPQQVAFQMADGRVYHRDLQMQIDDVIIRTRGSVGMDESVSLVAEIPVLDKWIDGERALAGLRGQVLTVPISGTLSRPQLDQRAITRLSGQLVRQAAEGYLRDEVQNQLQKQLNKLFD